MAVSAQTESFDALKADYPQLMKKFGKELEGQRADYIFAIDVSGTMNKYKDTVVPALGEFFRSLQEGDYVSIIQFGGEATNEVGSAGKISAETITNLINYAGHVYDTPTTAFEKEKYFKWTDLDNMLHYLANDMKQIDRRPTFSQEHIDQMRSECNLMATHFPYVFEVYDGGHSIFCHMEDKYKLEGLKSFLKTMYSKGIPTSMEENFSTTVPGFEADWKANLDKFKR